ncbi:MAG: hypothetical protein ACREBA_08095, partial [Nitrosotalea sp.]
MTETADSKLDLPVRRPPQVDKVLRHPIVQAIALSMSHDVLVELTRRELDLFRVYLKDSKNNVQSDNDLLEEAAHRVVAYAERLRTGGLQRVLNGTG